jgi:hypothetical protein
MLLNYACNNKSFVYIHSCQCQHPQLHQISRSPNDRLIVLLHTLSLVAQVKRLPYGAVTELFPAIARE